MADEVTVNKTDVNVLLRAARKWADLLEDNVEGLEAPHSRAEINDIDAAINRTEQSMKEV